MKFGPKPGDETTGQHYVYDAWNRLVKVQAGGNTVAEYEYDGRNFRTVKRTYSGGQLSETRHFYYNVGWQCVEERVDASSYADRQYVWGERYVDDLVLRDRDADSSSGTGSLGVSGSGLEERLYALQDPNWNVVAVANTSGAVQERYIYSSYGTPTVLTPTFGSRGTSSYEWDHLYTGRSQDTETSLYYYRNRYYHAELGRFLSRDPIGYKGGINLYEYCGDDPLVRTDPTGTIDFVYREFTMSGSCKKTGGSATYELKVRCGGMDPPCTKAANIAIARITALACCLSATTGWGNCSLLMNACIAAALPVTGTPFGCACFAVPTGK